LRTSGARRRGELAERQAAQGDGERLAAGVAGLAGEHGQEHGEHDERSIVPWK
jgi:hypothetical protein